MRAYYFGQRRLLTHDICTPPIRFCRFRGIFFILFLEEPDRNLQLSTIRFCLYKNGANQAQGECP